MIKKFILITTLFLVACTSSSVKENINKVGNAAGQATGEFIEGAVKGVKKAFDVKIDLPPDLKEKGIEFGKATVSSDSTGSDNLIVLYVIFNKDFEGQLIAKVFDEQSLEMGRSRVEINGKKDEAKFIEFHFDRRTGIGSKSKIIIE